jgi:acyl-coenzyme A synthetase/AMP-(fatty) acid ligase
VDNAVAVPVTVAGSARLALWYTGGPDLAAALRRHLAVRLPEFMVPHFVWHLDELPRNRNGKTDRHILAGLADRRVTAQVSPAGTRAVR